jgi:surface protein
MSRLVIRSNKELRRYVKNYFSDSFFGRVHPIGMWDVSSVTNMEGLFENYRNFNESINDWDVSNVTNMAIMFQNCESFNQPLDKWNTSNVTDMEGMFAGCINFNQSLDSWDTSKVTNMIALFQDCENFNQPLNNWNTSSVTDMTEIFHNCTNFNQPIGNWNTSNVRIIDHMFVGCSTFNQSLDNWNTSNVLSMSGVFKDCTNFNQPIGNWNTFRVTNMGAMFFNARNFNQPLNNWRTSNVSSMHAMFFNCLRFNQPLNNWNVARCETFNGMFTTNLQQQMAFRQDLSNWNMNRVGVRNSRMFSDDFPEDFKPLVLRNLRAPVVIQQAQEGIAFNVHNKFNKIDLNALVNLIKSGPDLDVYTGANLTQEWLAELRTLVENSGKPELLVKLNRLSGKISAIKFTEPINNLNSKNFFYTVLNFVKRQPKEYQDNYVTFLIDESFSAYDSGDTTSCVKGIQERLVLALGQAGYNLDSELYKQISAILFQVKDSQIFHFISTCLETNKSSFVGKPMDEKKQLLLNCVNDKLRESGEMANDSRIMELIGQSEDMLDDDALTGGKRRKRTRKNKKIKQRTNKRKTTNKRRTKRRK